jgi:hypothetical protein
MLEVLETQFFCSHCDEATSNFVEMEEAFYCKESCADLFSDSEEDSNDDGFSSDHDWLVSVGWGDDEDYGYYGE